MPEDDFDEDVLTEFVDTVVAGKATPYIKSEKVPKDQKTGVVKVVGKTFKKIVEDDSKVPIFLRNFYIFFSILLFKIFFRMS